MMTLQMHPQQLTPAEVDEQKALIKERFAPLCKCLFFQVRRGSARSQSRLHYCFLYDIMCALPVGGSVVHAEYTP